jgi:hypothetical protein
MDPAIVAGIGSVLSTARRDDWLVRIKSETRELGRGHAPPAIMALVWGELEHEDAPWREPLGRADHRQAADAFFLRMLEEFGRASAGACG